MTEDELTNRLRKAHEIVRDAGLPAEVHATAFALAYEALGGSAAAPAPISAHSESSPPLSPDGGSTIAMIAAGLGIGQDEAERVYSTSGGGVVLALRRSDLPNSKAQATRAIALLLVVARQLSGEEFVPYADIRDECRELKVFDSANFAAHVDRLEFRTRGKGTQREARANRHHFEEASSLIAELIATTQA